MNTAWINSTSIKKWQIGKWHLPQVQHLCSDLETLVSPPGLGTYISHCLYLFPKRYDIGLQSIAPAGLKPFRTNFKWIGHQVLHLRFPELSWVTNTNLGTICEKARAIRCTTQNVCIIAICFHVRAPEIRFPIYAYIYYINIRWGFVFLSQGTKRVQHKVAPPLAYLLGLLVRSLTHSETRCLEHVVTPMLFTTWNPTFVWEPMREQLVCIFIYLFIHFFIYESKWLSTIYIHSIY